MDMPYAGLARRLSSRKRGGFYPFTYSIALRGSVTEAISSAKSYPFAKPVSNETMQKFESTLTFWHEAAHLAQYVSSAFGLRALRRSLIAFRYLKEGGPWQLPVGSWLLELPERNDHQNRAMGRFLNFADAVDQLQLHVDQADEMPDASGPPVQLFWEPWSPVLFWGVNLDFLEDQRETLPVFRQPHVWLRKEKNAESVMLNAAVLMEGFALLVELNNICNALGLDADSLEKLTQITSSGNEYMAALQYGLDRGSFTEVTMIPVLAVCIDLALMYDPFVLYNSPNLEMPGPETPPDQYPGETFVLACSAAGHITPPRDWDDLGRFYTALCDYMNLPSPEWMAMRTHEVASNLLSSTGDTPLENVWLGAATAMHHSALELRVRNPQDFTRKLLTTDGILDVAERCVPHVSFYNLRDHQPEGSYHHYAKNIDLLSLHSLIHQAILQPRIDCPLKGGSPFFCPSSLSGPDTLCVFPMADGGQRECLVDIFEKLCKLHGTAPDTP
jgi:hypothetical protein